jgi:predicted signal transduction protein with EAL and GGDEF domain
MKSADSNIRADKQRLNPANHLGQDRIRDPINQFRLPCPPVNVAKMIGQHDTDRPVRIRDFDFEGITLLLSGCRADNAQARFSIVTLRERPFEFEGHVIPIAISVGLVSWSPRFETAAQLIEAADQCLYQAKASGRNRVVAAVDDTTVQER